MAYTKYVSIIERRVATIKGVTLVFKPMTPLEVHPDIEEDVIAAGIVREDLFNAAMSGNLSTQEELVVATAIRHQATEAGISADEPPNEDEFDNIVSELEAHKAAEHAKAEQLALAEAEERAEAEAEKSPAFDKAVFEAAVREIIATNDPAHLTPKGAPKAKVVSDLVGFEVKAIQVTNFLKTLD